MERNGWHIVQTDGVTTVTRCWPARFDVAVTATFPRVRVLRLARQIRQDMWRALRRLRGFAPAIVVTDRGDDLHVMAGGAVNGAIPPCAEVKIAALLSDPKRRKRWIDWASEGAHDG